MAGGQVVTIHGEGFDATSTVTLADGAAPCVVASANASVILCISGALGALRPASGAVVVASNNRFGDVASCCSYRYTAASTPIIAAVSPSSGTEGTRISVASSAN